MRRALIGYTGFVGGHLRKQQKFDELYNSKNIEDIKGEQFDEVYCAGVSAVKWKANNEPEKDLQQIQSLLKCLESVTTRRLILISTIDVFEININSSEIDHNYSTHAYGVNRLWFENELKRCFNCYIIRLPGLVGKGLKKNAIYDLKNLNGLENIPRNGRFQFYPVINLSHDLRRIVDLGIKEVNIVSDSLSIEEVLDWLQIDNMLIGSENPAKFHYCINTIYEEFHYSKQTIRTALMEYYYG